MNTRQPAPRRFSLFSKPLKQCIEPLTRPVFKEKGIAAARLLTQWPSIVGEELAAHSYPEKVSFPQGKKTDGTLTVAAASGFALQLQYAQPLILERLATYFGYKAISRIAITQNYQPIATEKRPAKSQPKVALDKTALETIDDPELKSAWSSLAETLAKNSQ